MRVALARQCNHHRRQIHADHGRAACGGGSRDDPWPGRHIEDASPGPHLGLGKQRLDRPSGHSGEEVAIGAGQPIVAGALERPEALIAGAGFVHGAISRRASTGLARGRRWIVSQCVGHIANRCRAMILRWIWLVPS